MKDWSVDRYVTAAKALGLLICTAFAVNAIAFTSRVAIPLPIADSWYFIHNFVHRALEGGLGVADFFAQRGPSDHAQPLQKLLLLIDVHVWDMDFRMEALIGGLLGVGTCAWLAWFVQRGARDVRETIAAVLCGCVLFGVGLSLNVTEPYTWYLVSYAWISVAISIAYWLWIGKEATIGATAAKAAIASLMLGLAMDEYAIPIYIALVIAIAIADGMPGWRKVLAVLGGGLAGIVVSRYLLRAMMENPADADASSSSVSALFGVLTQPDAWKLVVSPLADSLAHSLQLSPFLPRGWAAAQWVIALLLSAAHVAFWWRAFSPAVRPQRPVFILAVSFMLLFYASIAGIALSRLPTFGMDYLHQPRYITSYRLNIFALALMFLAPPAVAASAGRTWRLAVTGALAVIALQVPLSDMSWKSAVYIRNYVDANARAMAEFGRDPLRPLAGGCPSTMVVCNFPPPLRATIMKVLQKHRLSIYSERFRARNGLDGLAVSDNAGVAAAGALAAPETDRIAIRDRQPRRVVISAPSEIRLRIETSSSDF